MIVLSLENWTFMKFMIIKQAIMLVCVTSFSTSSLLYTKDIVMQKNKEEEIPPTEDLMREHGILNRVLLIYEELINRLDKAGTFPLDALVKSLTIIREFIENYHEELEQNHIFPLFEKHKKKVRLVRTLIKQHKKGREITDMLFKLAHHEALSHPHKKRTIKKLLKQFIEMYRPHEAREDTELFPLVRSLISEKEFKELGEKFEDKEHQLFGKEGFFTIVKKVEAIEKELGIYQLEKFTPKL
jgi:hemerythrin-like domain-containing protein